MRGVHPDSSFARLRADRRRSRDLEPGANQDNTPYLAVEAASNNRQPEPEQPPNPPPHRVANGSTWNRDPGYPPQAQRPLVQSNVTPGADNFSEAAAGGMAGIAYSVAERNARESGLEAMRGPDYPQQAYQQQGQWENQGQTYNQHGTRSGEAPHRPPYGMRDPFVDRGSQSTLQTLGASTTGGLTPSRSPHSFNNEVYTDDPYQIYSRPQDPHLGVVNPMEIEDDGDDGLVYGRKGPRASMLSLGGSGQRTPNSSTTGRSAAAGGVLGAIGGIVSRKGAGSRIGDSGISYDPVRNAGTGYGGNGGVYGSGDGSPWLEKQRKGSKKWKWAVIIGVGLIIAAAIVCGILFGVVFKQNSGGSTSTADGSSTSDDLDINSPQIKALLNNKNLHKVFPGIDYTPINTQYPACLSNPPSQNNVTMDLAVLSQLTNTIRLYGTDCNQTEMTLHALDKLGMNDTIKVWLGVWQDNNQTTNARQLAQMWDILDKYGEKPFKGLIVANEILFREQMTVTELSDLLDSVRKNVTAKGMSLPVATSDLGDNWTAELAEASDYVMANIHPFFGGVNAEDAASWTWNFWSQNDGPYFKSNASNNIIAETGWPSQGGTDCGTTSITDCPDASVAGIDQLNQYMEDWVCAALSNGTQYFWFEAFDEPWKIEFDTSTEKWEDHWGLMDVDRNLKDGVTIPDCDGKTV